MDARRYPGDPDRYREGSRRANSDIRQRSNTNSPRSRLLRPSIALSLPSTTGSITTNVFGLGIDRCLCPENEPSTRVFYNVTNALADGNSFRENKSSLLDLTRHSALSARELTVPEGFLKRSVNVLASLPMRRNTSQASGRRQRHV